MRPGTAGLLAVCAALFAAGSPSAPARAAPGDGKDDLRFAPGPPRDPAFLGKVNEAIDRGAAWMRARQGKDGTFSDPGNVGGGMAYPMGTTALGVHVLRSCGAPFEDPAIEKGIAALRKLWRAGGGGNAETYQVALTLLALEAHYAPEGEAGPTGRAASRKIPASDLEWIRAMARRLGTAQDSSGGFGYQGGDGYSRRRGGWDFSNTQYAVLGLKAARRCGVEMDERIFLRCLDHLLEMQEKTGPSVERRETDDGGGAGYGVRSRAAGRDRARGWGYSGPGGASGSMTSGGVSSMVICRGELQGAKRYPASLDARVVTSIRDGIAWLGHNFTVQGNPGAGRASWHYYWLYGLERAGVLAGVTWVAEHDWYLEGANFLLPVQAKDGGWGGPGLFGAAPGRRGGKAAAPPSGNLLDTAFALLFLRKATFRVEGAVATEESDRTLDLTGAADLDDASFRAVFDSVFGRFARAAEMDRGALAADFVRMGTRALGLLILALEAEGEGDRGTALDALRRVTGLTHGYEAAAAQEVRSRAVADWEAWYFARRGTLSAVDGRFR